MVSRVIKEVLVLKENKGLLELKVKTAETALLVKEENKGLLVTLVLMVLKDNKALEDILVQPV